MSFRNCILLILTLVASFSAASCAGIGSQSAPLQDPSAQSKVVLIPNAIDFSSVVLGQKNSQTVRMSNEGASNLQVQSINVTGNGFGIAGVSFPFSLQPQASTTFNVEFAPKSLGPVSGSLTIKSNFVNSTIADVKGVGTNSLQKLLTKPASISFGNLNVKGTAAQKIVVTNTGNSTVTVNQVVLAGIGFALSESASHFELAPQQETSLLVSFNPQVLGKASGTLKFVSKQLSAPLIVPLAGDAVSSTAKPAASIHTVKLTWDASPGNIKGYYVFRGESSGGPYSSLTPSPVSALEYTDSDVESGQEYFYVVAAINNGGHESNYSQQVSVLIPSP